MSKEPREFFLGISEGNTPYVSDKRVWSTDYHLIEYSAYETLTAEVKRYEEALEFSKMTLEHAIALDYLGEGSTRGMANDAISMIESALNQDDK